MSQRFLLFLLAFVTLLLWCNQVLCVGYTIVGDITADPIIQDASLTRLKSIVGTCVDPRNGDIYVMDDGYYRIFKIDSQTNQVSWYAGNGVQYSCYRTLNINLCGHGTDKKNAGFKPSQCAVDPINGDLYFSDTTYHMVRKIDAATGILTILVGNGWTTGSNVNQNGVDAFTINVALNVPYGLAVDANYVYIADSLNYCIRKIHKASNLIYTHAGSCGTAGATNAATTTAARFYQVYGMAIAADGTMFVVDKQAHTIRRITPSGSVELYAGVTNTGCSNPTANPACGDGSDRLVVNFKDPHAITLDSNNNVYVFDYSSYRIRKIDNSTGIVSTVVGIGSNAAYPTGPSGAGQLGTSVGISVASTSQGIACYGNYLYYNDRSNLYGLRQLDLTTGIVTTLMGTYSGNSQIGFGLPLTHARVRYHLPLLLKSALVH